jgi:flagellar M-ring protein FliF
VKEILKQWTQAWARASAPRRAAGLGAAAVLVGAVVLAVGLATRPEYALLYGGLEPSEAAAILEKVRGTGTPAEVRDGGGSVYVPEGRVAEMRLVAAAEGLPRGGGGGFELFDRSNFGLSDFVQNVNYVRALQGELARTIASLEPVERASVHLTRPRPSPFVGEDREPTASVLVHLRPGRSLGSQQVAAIAHLVAGSLEGLDPSKVKVVDQEGRVLSSHPDDPATQASDRQLAIRREFEEYLTRRAQEMLDAVLGPARSVVRVSAELDFEKVNETAETFDPDVRVVKNETLETRKLKAIETSSGGAAGTAAALRAGEGAPVPGPGEQDDSETSSIHYEGDRTVRSSVKDGVKVTRLSVSLVVDPALESRLDPELQEVVREAVGFDEKRGDTIKSMALEFAAPPEATAEAGGVFASALVPTLLERGIEILAIGGALFLLGRVLRSLVAGKAPAVEVAAAAGAAAGPPLPPGAERERLRQQLRETVRQNPARASQVVRRWLREGEPAT